MARKYNFNLMAHDKYTCFCKGDNKYRKFCEQMRQENNVTQRFCLVCGNRLHKESYPKAHIQCYAKYLKNEIRYDITGKELIQTDSK